MVNYYSKLFTKDENLDNNYQILENFNWSTVDEDQNLLLTATPSHEEIQTAVFALDLASSLGPDDFSGSFYQKC